VARVVTPAPPAPSFGGPGHEAVFVVDADGYDHDPFILLADGRPAHQNALPLAAGIRNARFKTAVFDINGELDGGEESVIREEDVLFRTAAVA